MIANAFEVCEGCDREILRTEPACVFKGRIVCEICDRRLRRGSELKPAVRAHVSSDGTAGTGNQMSSSKPADDAICEVLGLDDLELESPRPRHQAMGFPLETVPTETRYRGVKGWLLLLCIIMTIISPLANAAYIIINHGNLSPLYERFPELQLTFIFDALLRLGLMAFSIYAGTALWRVRPNAVALAKMSWALFLGFAILSIFLPLTAGLPPEAYPQIIREGFRGAFGPFLAYQLWTAYLNKSKRVKATYAYYAGTGCSRCEKHTNVSSTYRSI